MMINTVYILKNKCNSKVYIGQTWTTLEERGHYGHGYKGCIHLENAIKLYGWKDNFYYETLAYCESKEDADKVETFFIKLYDSRNPEKGYNIREGGSRGKHSVSSKAKISKSMTGKTASEETKLKMSKSLKGIPKSEETKAKMSKSLMGHPVSEEQKAKMSKSHKGKPAHNKGVPMSEEQKAKISKTLTGKTPWNKGVPQSEEAKAKISKSLMGNTNAKGKPGI